MNQRRAGYLTRKCAEQRETSHVSDQTSEETKDEASDRPEPKAEPREPPPGGPHAVPGVGGEGPYTRIPRDLDPDLNPATDDEQLPDETKEPDSTETEATKGGDEQESEGEPSA